MALSTDIIRRIRIEVGETQDVTDEATSPAAPVGDLESLYNDVEIGNGNVLRTALAVWRKRLMNMSSGAFDATAGGRLMARSQEVRYAQRRVKELALLVDYTLKGVNDTVKSNYQRDSSSAEF